MMRPRQRTRDGHPTSSAEPTFATALTGEGHDLILRRVPKYQDRLDRMFHALGDSSRRAMVERLARSPASVSELARPFAMAMPSVVQHLGVLEAAGIVQSSKVGRVRTYQLAADALTPAAEWISQQLLPAERRLDRLGAFLDTATNQETT
jgi:DNA-binding transcriptional ArsR family regulator